MAANIKLLSAGAVKPGLSKAVDAFRRASGLEVIVAFATAPEIRHRVLAGEDADIVIAPETLIEELVNAGKLNVAARGTLGRIGVGVMVRAERSSPRVATAQEFTKSMLDAESVIYNQASTGTYIENLFDRLGIADALKAKTMRYANFAAVLEHIRKGRGYEIALGATTVILENADQGINYAGPLPADLQNYTTYATAAATNSGDGAVQLVRYLTGPSAKLLFREAGIE